jgi:gamma-glutamylaminecyclotransferase
MNTVFVYGTLKRGYGNNRLIEQGGGEFLGEATTVDAMYLCGEWVPFASDNVPCHEQALPIRGEVFRVDDATLARLDSLEGHPYAYRRTPTKVLLIGDERPLDAEIYIHPRAADRAGDACPVVNGAYEWGRDW